MGFELLRVGIRPGEITGGEVLRDERREGVALVGLNVGFAELLQLRVGGGELVDRIGKLIGEALGFLGDDDLGGFSTDGLDAADPGGDSAFALDLEVTDRSRRFHVGAATEFH